MTRARTRHFQNLAALDGHFDWHPAMLDHAVALRAATTARVPLLSALLAATTLCCLSLLWSTS